MPNLHQPDEANLEQSKLGSSDGRTRSRSGLVIALAGLLLLIVGGASRLLWPSHPDSAVDAQTTSSTTVPGTGTPAGAIDNSAPANQPVQTVPTDRSENNQRGLNSTPERPTRDGVQR
jgi:hypothetical protein